jgi:hypothetical protein
MTWNERFLALFDRCVAVYRGGNRDFTTYYGQPEFAFLDSIGYKPREFFDFVEDFCEESDPSPSTALLIAAVRRDYFLVIQEGELSPRPLVTRDQLPTFGDELHGIAYLPRILAKARAKLRGELDPDVMFGCGGDRKFLRDHGDIHPADFLRYVWAAHDDDELIAHWVKSGGKP